MPSVPIDVEPDVDEPPLSCHECSDDVEPRDGLDNAEGPLCLDCVHNAVRELALDCSWFCDTCDGGHVHPSWGYAISPRQLNRWCTDVGVSVPLFEQVWRTANYDATALRYAEDGETSYCDDNPPSCSSCGEVDDTPDVEQPPDWSGSVHAMMCSYCIDESSSYDGSHDDDDAIHSWNYTPELRFRTVDGTYSDWQIRTTPDLAATPFLGLEIETSANAQFSSIVTGAPPDVMYGKSDSSIGGSNPVEIVTHPATLDWFNDHFPWQVLSDMAKSGAKSYRDASCGIHIHVSAAAFTAPHMFRFLAFHYRNPSTAQAIGQRGSVNYCSWSKWLETRPNIIKYATKRQKPSDRYMAVNLTNDETIELRYFRGNLNPARVRKNLQWVQAVYEYTKSVPVGADGLESPLLSAASLFEWLRDPDVPSRGRRFADLLTFINDRAAFDIAVDCDDDV